MGQHNLHRIYHKNHPKGVRVGRPFGLHEIGAIYRLQGMKTPAHVVSYSFGEKTFVKFDDSMSGNADGNSV